MLWVIAAVITGVGLSIQPRYMRRIWWTVQGIRMGSANLWKRVEAKLISSHLLAQRFRGFQVCGAARGEPTGYHAANNRHT